MRQPLSLSFECSILKYSFILLIGFILLAGAIVSCSHPAPNRKKGPVTKEAKPADQIISEMRATLNLTNEQEVKLRPIIEEQVKRRNELIKKYEEGKCRGTDCLIDPLKDLRISTESQLQYFLTNDQMIKYGNVQQEEDQRIVRMATERPSEEVIKEKPQRKGRRSGGF